MLEAMGTSVSESGPGSCRSLIEEGYGVDQQTQKVRAMSSNDDQSSDSVQPEGPQDPQQPPHDRADYDRPRAQPRYGQYAPQPDGGQPGSAPSAPSAPPGASPYGQDPYGQGAYGQGGYGQDPYGQGPYGQGPYSQPPQPGYSASPYAGPGQPNVGTGQPGTPPGGRPSRPASMTTSMALQLLAGAVLAIVGIFSGVAITRAEPTQMMSSDQWAELGITAAEIEQMGMMGLVGAVIIGGAVLFAIPYVIFAFTSTRGSQVGRILATIYLGLSVFSVVFGAWNLLLVFLPSLAALILLWVPASSAFVRQVQAAKKPGGPPGGGYGPGQGGQYGYGGPAGHPGYGQQGGQYGGQPYSS